MSSKMGNITQLAFKAISDDQLLLDKYSTPEAVLDYLEDTKNFKNLSDQLKETMREAGVCDENSSQEHYVDTLYERLVKQDTECGKEKTRNINTVKRWLNGTTQSIRYRTDVIEICFALELDSELAVSLLNKCGYNGFNVRNAEDAAYLYGILNHRPLSVVRKIIDDFNSHMAESQNNGSESFDNVHSGCTTYFLDQIMGNSNWTNDDEFLNTFLIPNKAKFIGYTAAAVSEYYVLKNRLFIVVLMDAVSSYNEGHLVSEYNDDSNEDITHNDIPVSFAVKSALRKCSESSSVLNAVNSMLKEDMSNTNDILSQIKEIIIHSDTDIDTQMQIADFLNDIMKIEGVLKFAVKSIRGEKDRIRKYSESALKDTVMKEFPNDKSFANFEKDYSKISRDMATRKAIILMYYITYAYEYSSYIMDYTYESEIFGDMGFAEFMDGLNLILSKSKLPPLYPANQFDWLILRSIREFDISDLEDADSPIEFFNDVISFSFGDEHEQLSF